MMTSALTSPDHFTRMSAETAISPAQIDAVIDHLRAESIETRWRAAAALGHAGDRRAIDPLCALLDDDDRDVRMNAMIALVRLSADHVTDVIAERAFDPEEDHQTRYVAALVLVALLGIDAARAVFAAHDPVDEGVIRAAWAAWAVSEHAL